MSKDKINYTEGSGNVYQDLDYADAKERLVKAKLAMCIEAIIDKRKLKQVEAAKILGITQSKVSAIVNGRLKGFSMEKLIHFLNCLNQDVEIIVKTKPSRATRCGRLKVAFG